MSAAAPDMSVAGDQDRWMLLERESAEDFPLMVRCRVNQNIDEFVSENALSAVCFWAETDDQVDDFGFPKKIVELQELEDVANEQLTDAGITAFHTASVTGEGQRVLYFAHAPDTPLPFDWGALSLAGFQVKLLPVENRHAYLGLTVPTAVDVQLDGDRGVISNLEKHGDDATVPRKADFWFYGKKAALKSLVADLEPWGYSVDRWLDDPEGVVVTSETPVNFGTFREVTPVLVGAAERHGVVYDGWETVIVSPDMPEPPQPTKPQSKSLLSKLFGAKKN